MRNFIKVCSLCMLLLLSYVSSAQTQVGSYEKKLLDSTSLRISLKTCILMETDTFIVFTPAKYLLEPFAKWVQEHPEFPEDKRLYKFISTDTTYKRLIKANDVARDYSLSPNLIPQIANCLKIGRVCILNRKTGELEKKVTVNDYLVNEHGEIRFLINGVLLLSIYDK